MKKTVNDMFVYSSENNIKLLSSFNGSFWSDYVSNYAKYDKIFKRLYKSFVYFEQLDDEDIEDVVTNFTEAVEGHLILNQKKYSELYRINVVSDDDYSLLDNVNITEVMDREGSSTEGARSDSETQGQRSDSGTNNIGAQTVTDTGEVSPYDSENFFNNDKMSSSKGARSDSESYTKGAQSNSFSKGEQQNGYTEDYTFTRNGNNGNIVGADMLNKHSRYWNLYEFYSYIFGEIAKELLLTY